MITSTVHLSLRFSKSRFPRNNETRLIYVERYANAHKARLYNLGAHGATAATNVFPPRLYFRGNFVLHRQEAAAASSSVKPTNRTKTSHRRKRLRQVKYLTFSLKLHNRP
jgi:hypothetical protein